MPRETGPIERTTVRSADYRIDAAAQRLTDAIIGSAREQGKTDPDVVMNHAISAIEDVLVAAADRLRTSAEYLNADGYKPETADAVNLVAGVFESMVRPERGPDTPNRRRSTAELHLMVAYPDINPLEH